MAGLQFDLTAPDVWEHVYDESKTAEQPTPQTFISIPRITIPVLLHERVIVVGTSSINAKPNWRFSGTLSQRLVIPNLGSGLVDGHKETIRINALSLIVMPLLTPDYRLQVDVFPWIRDLSISIWRYVGAEVDELVQLLETVKVDIVRVESKIDRQSPNTPTFTDKLPDDVDNTST
jgi:hypothetical protein